MEKKIKQLSLNLDFNVYDQKPPEGFNINFSNEVDIETLDLALKTNEANRLCDHPKYKESGPSWGIKDYGRFKLDIKIIRIFCIQPSLYNELPQGFEEGFNHIQIPIIGSPIEIIIPSHYRDELNKKILFTEIYTL